MDNNLEKEYEARFSWRISRQFENFKELAEFAHTGGGDTLNRFPKLRYKFEDTPEDALKHSIFLLWNEAVECYIFGEFQSCLMTCGAVVERCLKLEFELDYQEKNGQPKPSRKWTLGTAIKDTQGIVSSEISQLADKLLDPRNSLTHALMEHSDPRKSLLGSERYMYQMGPKYLIEPFRGDTKQAIEITFQILTKLYSI
ncbi:MAG: hypothetical protein ABI947_17830 [Chloroflexota bacterium]